MWLVHLMIGGENDNEDNDTSANKRNTVLVQHALENFKHVEQQLAQREQVLEANQKKLGEQLDKVTKSDSSALRLLKLTHYIHCNEILSIIEKKYDDLILQWDSTKLN